ncbi:MAG: RluA family pseudouridine synthase, partial [Chitinophagales bacterium]
ATSNQPTILKETEHWVALNKPPSVVVHDVPGEKHAGTTLVDWLRAHIPAIQQHFASNDARPGIVHRLDADTSGVILVAKDPETLQALQDQFRSRTTGKTYHALVLGNVSHAGELVGNIVRTGTDTEHTVKRLSFSWDKHEAKPAETDYQPIGHYVDADERHYTLLALQPKTGRTHQLRVQLLDAGWPIIGDPMYSTKDSRAASDLLSLHRQFLHAVTLEFDDPSTEERIIVQSPFANDLESILDKLTTVSRKEHRG